LDGKERKKELSKRNFLAAALGLALALIFMLAVCLHVMAQELRIAQERLDDAYEEIVESERKISAARRTTAALEDTVFQLRQENEAQVEELALRKKLATLSKMENITVSHYCCELYEHICGTGDGLTASGVPVQAGVSVAVDPEIIPLGSTVFVDYGDGHIHTYTAHDVGGYIKGKHIDVAVETHDMAVAMGLRTANIWWEENK
jgi:3D (Asp-Asp-Asp) domain-containing protein